MKKSEYVADGWAIEWLKNPNGKWELLNHSNYPTRIKCIGQFENYFNNHIAFTRRVWKQIEPQGYRCIRVYRKVSK